MKSKTESNTKRAGVAVDAPVRPFIVTVTREEAITARSQALYHYGVAQKIRDVGIPLGHMLWLAGISEMSQDEIDRGWLKELSRFNLSRVDVESLPDGGIRILLWPNNP
jgi:hypothetical protein